MMGVVLPVVALALVALIGWRTGKIKTRKGQGKLIAAFLVVWMLLAAVENFFPIENLFLTFHSPEAAYRFQSSGVTDIQVIEGEQSAFVWGTDKDDAIAFRIIPKTDKGWKCSGVLDVDFPTFYPDSGIEVNIFRHKRSGDCYAMVENMRKKNSVITDERGSQFQPEEESAEHMYYEYYKSFAYIGKPSGTYTLTIDGVEYTLTGLP